MNDLDNTAEIIRLSKELAIFEVKLRAKTIFFDSEQLTISEACKKITPEAISHGDYCEQTVSDLMEILNLINSDLL
jgi:hypothetical protein